MERNQETYKQFIQEIIKERGKHGCEKVYYEKHHIIPKCLGGENSVDNIIDLFPKEHFIAHMLLAKENPHNKKLQYAWWMMAHCIDKDGKRYRCTAEEYAEARNAFSNARKGHKVSAETRKKISEAQLGEKSRNYGTHSSEKTKKKISKALKGENSVFYGKPLSEEHKRKVSEALKGENNPNYGKPRSEETKKKIGKANSKAVKCVETGIVYCSSNEAERQTGIKQGNIIKCCRGQRPKAGGFHWEYANEK